MKIIDNLCNGDCALWFDIQIISDKGLVHCVCPFSKCHSFNDAINYYYKHFHKPNHIILLATYHKYSKADLDNLAKCT